MRGLGIFFIAAGVVLYIANGAHIETHGDISSPALIIGTMSTGAGMGFLFSHWLQGRKR